MVKTDGSWFYSGHRQLLKLTADVLFLLHNVYLNTRLWGTGSVKRQNSLRKTPIRINRPLITLFWLVSGKDLYTLCQFWLLINGFLRIKIISWLVLETKTNIKWVHEICAQLAMSNLQRLENCRSKASTDFWHSSPVALKFVLATLVVKSGLYIS